MSFIMSSYYISYLFVFCVDIVLWLFLVGSLVVVKSGLICSLSSVPCFTSDFGTCNLLQGCLVLLLVLRVVFSLMANGLKKVSDFLVFF